MAFLPCLPIRKTGTIALRSAHNPSDARVVRRDRTCLSAEDKTVVRGPRKQSNGRTVDDSQGPRLTESRLEDRTLRDALTMKPEDAYLRFNELLSHVWVVRTFLKHSEEAEQDEELREVPRELYDYCLALGPATQAGDVRAFGKMARKKFAKLKQACELFQAIQEDVSTHTNFRMAAESLRVAVRELEQLLPCFESSSTGPAQNPRATNNPVADGSSAPGPA